MMEAVTHLMKSWRYKEAKIRCTLVQLWEAPSQTTHHERPAEALEALVKLGGVGEEQEERRQELQQRHRHKSGGSGGREAHERHERQDLRRRVREFSPGRRENASHPSEIRFLCPRSCDSDRVTAPGSLPVRGAGCKKTVFISTGL